MTSFDLVEVEVGDRSVLLNRAEAKVTHKERPAMVDGRERCIFTHDVKEILPAQ